MKTAWRLAIDTGGTFTDGIAIAPDGSQYRSKVLSSSAIRVTARRINRFGVYELSFRGITPPPGLLTGFSVAQPGGEALATVLDHPTRDRILLEETGTMPESAALELRAPFDAPALCLYLLLGTTPADPLPPIELRVATTRATNALLENRGAAFGLVVDHGFEDLLAIGDQSRPDLFALDIKRRRLQPTAVASLTTRLGRSGELLSSGSEEELDGIARTMKTRGITTVGVSLVHGWRNPEHEQSVVEALKQRGLETVIAATDLSNAEGLTARTETVAVEASVRPVLQDFLDGIPSGDEPDTRSLLVMTSSGGLALSENFQAKDGLLSGPAGGVVGAAHSAASLGIHKILGFDMGGTSTDVSRYDEQMLYRFETTVGPARIQAPCVAIETVAAGGGSICHWGVNGLSVGPQSAGASPGPASYGAGGPLTLTDVNLLLGRADPERFGVPLDLSAAHHALASLIDQIRSSGQDAPPPDELLLGLLDIANERMAETMRSVSIREGADPEQHVLVPFGGAGGQHACAIAERLGINRILLPLDSGILSARGALLATNEQFVERTINEPLETCGKGLDDLRRILEHESTRQLPDPTNATTRSIVGMRLSGQDEVLQLPFESSLELEEAFVEKFTLIYGYSPPARPVEVAWIRVRAAEENPLQLPGMLEHHDSPPNDTRTIDMLVGTTRRTVKVLQRQQMAEGVPQSGPFLLADAGATTVIDTGWEATLNPDGTLLCTAQPESGQEHSVRNSRGSAASELVAARLESIATAMGRLLERTALSVNVKQRLDFSCALLDATGQLLVNAPHMPIHLGSMGICVRNTLTHLTPDPGDVLVTNHPGCGGSHLPDITTIAPIYERNDGGELLGYAAVRAHHAELGGSRPGSTPPFATTLAEEGVLIPPMKLVKSGQTQFDRVEELLTGALWPSRRPKENIADLRAQLAATEHGILRVRELADAIGTSGYLELAGRVRMNAAAAASRAISRLGDLDRHVQQTLDDGSVIALHAMTAEGRLRLDFTGSNHLHERNFNAPIAIVTGACVYLLRLLAGEAVPMNEGLLEHVDLIVPEGMINPRFGVDPAACPAVCAGNTETSQRITDTLLLAFDLAACSQGTMNNLLFGNDEFGYYETIAGGSGATMQAAGASGVHTHMTNTRITDPEIMESRFPVRLERFSLRIDSGGPGRHRGGDGVIRTIRALATLDVSFVSQHRSHGPYGLHGGAPGTPGTQYLQRSDGTQSEFGSCDECTLQPGDTITIETPGGGGWGSED